MGCVRSRTLRADQEWLLGLGWGVVVNGQIWDRGKRACDEQQQHHKAAAWLSRG